MKRKLFIATSLSAALSACSAVGTKLNDDPAFHRVLGAAQSIDERLIGTRGLVREYSPRDVSTNFPLDSLPTPASSQYLALVGDRFDSYRLTVDGAVEHPGHFTLAQLEHLTNVSQITRHDCVEGWSAVAQWQGVRLARLLAAVRPRIQARYLVFHSFDTDANGMPYYESLSLAQAAHPQTLLALRQNGKAISVQRGAPVRLVVPTQLGYKSAKWVRRIELVSSLSGLYGGKGGYWEDQGYEWYAGI